MVENSINLIILDQIWKPGNTRILLCVSHINSCTASMEGNCKDQIPPHFPTAACLINLSLHSSGLPVHMKVGSDNHIINYNNIN